MKLAGGGTAPVYGLVSPDGPRALKIYDATYSEGDRGDIEERRVDQQKALGRHGHPGIVEIYDGGRFEDRIFLLMNRAPGTELEKRLSDVPREKIRSIVDQVARAAIFLRDRGLCHRDIKSANIFISDDFSNVTLLDLSVMRDINDPVGLGTDSGDRLPVVATARYSPPEYLFRLLDPGPNAWRALDIYQLGALLHDLIMREPLFEASYLAAKDNRYRFAWTVATVDPVIDADDVDSDLLVLARRALDKDWKRRLSLDLNSFLNDAPTRQSRALGMIGFQQQPISKQGKSIVEARERLRTLAEEMLEIITQELLSRNIRCKHELQWPDDSTVHLLFSWEATQTLQIPGGSFTLRVGLRNDDSSSGLKALSSVSLLHDSQEVGVELPGVPWVASPANLIATSVMKTIGELAVSLTQMHPARS